MEGPMPSHPGSLIRKILLALRQVFQAAPREAALLLGLLALGGLLPVAVLGLTRTLVDGLARELGRGSLTLDLFWPLAGLAIFPGGLDGLVENGLPLLCVGPRGPRPVRALWGVQGPGGRQPEGARGSLRGHRGPQRGGEEQPLEGHPGPCALPGRGPGFGAFFEGNRSPVVRLRAPDQDL